MIVLESHSRWTVLIQSWDALQSLHCQNATDLIQVVDFTSLMQVYHQVDEACWLHQVASSL